MADEPVDYSQIFNFVYRIDKRVNYLEKDLTYLEKKISGLENKRSEDFIKLNEEIKKLHSAIANLKGTFNQCTHYMGALGKELRDSIKTDELTSLNSAVDEVKFEEYVTRREIINKSFR